VLTKLRGKKPDAIFYGGMDATGGPLMKQGRELGIKAVFAFGDGACTDKMKELAGEASEGLLCSQAGIPVAAASRKFLDAYKAKFNVDPILYAPFTYDAANLIIESMRKANSTDPAKYLPELAKISFNGATGRIQFDDKGDRKDAEMTIFTMKGGKIEPVAIIKGGQTIPYNDFIQQAAAAVKAPGDAAKAAADAAGKK
jgi:branched-chain amino acid transport system substrate-binding protein